MPSGRAWGWFGAWAVAGGLLAFSFLAGFSVGLFTLPFAALAFWAVAAKSPDRSPAFGVVSGIGLLSLAAWALHRAARPCPADGALSGDAAAPGETCVGCGGVVPQPWLVAASVFVIVGGLAFVVARRWDRRSALG